MKTYYTSDLHFEWERILEITDRDLHFGGILEHNEVLLDNINQVVGVDDCLVIAGDTCSYHWFEQIRCERIWHVNGNHDHDISYHVPDTLEQLSHNFEGQDIFISHFPHAYWPHSEQGAIHLYGHLHGYRERTLDKLFPSRRAMDIGVDNARRLLGEYRPFEHSEIMEILGDRTGHDRLQFYIDEREMQRR